jgi:hypothetical protein
MKHNRRIAEEVLANAGNWTTPSGEADKRDYFAGLLNHPSSNIVYTALRELDAISLRGPERWYVSRHY